MAPETTIALPDDLDAPLVLAAPTTTKPRGAHRRRGNPDLMKMAALYGAGHGVTEIARMFGVNRLTVYRALKAGGVVSAIKKAGDYTARNALRIAKLAVEGTIAKGDHKTAVVIAERMGVFDAARPAKGEPEGGRIVIEWNGAPPQWAPKPVLDAYRASHPEGVTDVP
jgi:hypothetical protein